MLHSVRNITKSGVTLFWAKNTETDMWDLSNIQHLSFFFLDILSILKSCFQGERHKEGETNQSPFDWQVFIFHSFWLWRKNKTGSRKEIYPKIEVGTFERGPADCENARRHYRLPTHSPKRENQTQYWIWQRGPTLSGAYWAMWSGVGWDVRRGRRLDTWS